MNFKKSNITLKKFNHSIMKIGSLNQENNNIKYMCRNYFGADVGGCHGHGVQIFTFKDSGFSIFLNFVVILDQRMVVVKLFSNAMQFVTVGSMEDEDERDGDMIEDVFMESNSATITLHLG